MRSRSFTAGGGTDGAGEHVRGGVPQDVAAVGAVDAHRLDHVAVGQHRGEVDQLAPAARDAL